MEDLIKTHIGLFLVGTTHYLQMITAEQEFFYYFKLHKKAAAKFSRKEQLQIVEIEQLPPGGIILGESALIQFT